MCKGRRACQGAGDRTTRGRKKTKTASSKQAAITRDGRKSKVQGGRILELAHRYSCTNTGFIYLKVDTVTDVPHFCPLPPFPQFPHPRPSSRCCLCPWVINASFSSNSEFRSLADRPQSTPFQKLNKYNWVHIQPPLNVCQSPQGAPSNILFLKLDDGNLRCIKFF